MAWGRGLSGGRRAIGDDDVELYVFVRRLT